MQVRWQAWQHVHVQRVVLVYVVVICVGLGGWAPWAPAPGNGVRVGCALLTCDRSTPRLRVSLFYPTYYVASVQRWGWGPTTVAPGGLLLGPCIVCERVGAWRTVFAQAPDRPTLRVIAPV